MKGIVFTEFVEMVEERFGWELMATEEVGAQAKWVTTPQWRHTHLLVAHRQCTSFGWEV